MVGELSGSDHAAARMHYLLLDFGGWRSPGEESLRLWRELGDKWWMTVTLELVGVLSLFEGDQITARARFEEGVSLARRTKNKSPGSLISPATKKVWKRLAQRNWKAR